MSGLDLYEIGVSFIIEREIVADVENLEKGFSTLQDAIDKVNESLGSTTASIERLVGAAGGIASAFDAAARAADSMAAAADRIGGGVAGGGVGGGGGGEYNPGGFTMPGYRDPNLLAISGPDSVYPPSDGGGGSSHASGHTISPMDYILAGGAAYEGGKYLITKPYESAAGILHQEFMMRGMSDKASPQDIQGAAEAARKLQQEYPGVSWQAALGVIGDAYMQTRGSGGMPEAIKAAQFLVQDAYDLHQAGQDASADSLIDLLKSGDIRGMLNQRNPDGSVNYGPMRAFVDEATRISISEHGRVTPSDVLAIVTNAGAEGTMMDQDALDIAMLMAANGMGAGRVGTGLQALSAQFLGGKMSQASARVLHELGLLPDWMFGPHDGKILKKYQTGIGQVLLPPGALEGQEEFEQNPFKWIDDDLWPAIEKKYPHNKTAQLSELYASISRLPGSTLIAEYIATDPIIQRQLHNLGNVGSTADLANLAKNDPTNIASGLTNAFDAFMAALGGGAMPTVIAQIKGLTGALNGLTDWATGHPNADTDIFRAAEGAAVVGGGAILFGAFKWLSKLVGGGAGGAGDASFFDGAGGAAADGAVDLGLGAAFASSPPAWLVVMTGAVVTELMQRGVFDNYANAPGGPKASRQNLAPTGKPGDPVHVKVVNAAPYQTNMPTGTTTPKAAQSMPMPGKVNQY